MNQVPGAGRGMLFVPSAAARLDGVVVMLPGSGGGLGPGLVRAPQPFAAAGRRATHGALYVRLALEVATGRRYSWAFKETGADVSDQSRCAALLMDWSVIPRTRLRRRDMLEAGVSDAKAALRFVQRRFAGAPIVVVGFSWGGCVLWSALSEIANDDDCAGAVAIAGSARGGAQLEAAGLDSIAGVRACAERGGALLFLHGTHDKNVATQVADFLFDAAQTDLKRLVKFNRAQHMFDTARDVAYAELQSWTRAALARKREAAVDFKALSGVAARGRPLNDPNAGRLLPSRRRLAKVAVAPGHALSGLVGYSE